MASKISAVINVLNEEKNIERAIKSVKWADEIVIADDGSTDRTLEILAQLKLKNTKLKIVKHKSAGFVEPARNFAISKAANEWILILDADEQIPESLAQRLIEIASNTEQIDYVRLSRKNIIFGKWMRASMWWPDYNIRFFKKGKVKWVDQIHRPPEISGQGLDLPGNDERYAIIHRNYDTTTQFLDRMNRYTSIQAEELRRAGDQFDWKDLFEKPLNEFLSRFFANNGYKDGLHGLALSFLQAFSSMVVYLKLWEIEKFKEQEIDLNELDNQKDKSAKTIDYWMKKSGQTGDLFKSLFKKFKG